MDGWQHLLRRQRSLQSEARSEHHRRAPLLPSRVSPVAHVGRRLLLTTLAASGPDTTAAAATAKNTNRCSGGAALPSPAPDRRPPWTLERVEAGDRDGETRDCDRMTGSRGKRGEREYKGR